MYGKMARYNKPIKIMFVVLCISVLIILMLGFSSASPAYSRASSPMDPFRAVESGSARANILNVTGENEFLNEAEHLRKFAIWLAADSFYIVFALSFSLIVIAYHFLKDITPTSNNVKLNI